MTRTPLFKKKTKNELREMIHDLAHKKCTKSMWDEIYEHESRKSKESQLKFLNKFDLTMIIYSILQDEIKEIDETVQSIIEKSNNDRFLDNRDRKLLYFKKTLLSENKSQISSTDSAEESFNLKALSVRL